MRRDDFLRAAALTFVGANTAAVGVFGIGSLALSAHVPLLHGDGVADDTEALQAMAGGDIYVDVRDGKVHRQLGVVHLRPGTYKIRGAIRLRSHQVVDGHGCRLAQAVPGEPSLIVSEGDTVRGFCFISEPGVALGAPETT